ncbi:MAG: hypothetical protein ABSC48_15675 [Terracidiphilus sp.]|jgi:hypothetical protein
MNHVPTLDEPPGQFHSRWPEWAALGLYAGLVAFAIPYHEPSADVAQAWQLARSLSLPALFETYIRYEGSPGLWHFLLWLLIRAHLSYAGLSWICGAIAVGATALLLFKSPFPSYLKLALPFTFFLVFQYAIAARSYVLVPILLYLIALRWKKSPLVLALLLGLLANVALHAAVISAGLALVYLIEQLQNRGALNPRRRRQFWWAGLLLLSFWTFALWTAWPPRDLTDYLSFRLHSSLFSSFARSLASLVLPVFQPWVLSIPFWVAIALCLRARRRLFYLLPVLFLAAFCGAVASDWWHFGLMVPLAISLSWMTWPDSGLTPTRRESAGRMALAAVACLQIFWSAYAIEFDHYHAYSPDLATAGFLRPFVQRGSTIAITDLHDPVAHAGAFFSVGVLPYFERGIFVNQQEPFWSWSDQNPTEEGFLKALPLHPAVVVVGVYGTSPDAPSVLSHPRIQMLNRAGYRMTNVFCGAMPEGFRLMNHNCDLIFQRIDGTQQDSGKEANRSSGAK